MIFIIFVDPISVTADVTCRDAIDIMSSNGFDMVPVVDSSDDKKLVGVVTEGNLTGRMMQGKIQANQPVEFFTFILLNHFWSPIFSILSNMNSFLI